MKRREFISLLGGAAAAGSGIGVLMPGASDAREFQARLADLPAGI